MTDTTGLVPQPTYSPDTPLADLPRVIERKCCPHKSCGNTTLELRASRHQDLLAGTDVTSYAYRRGNGYNGYEDGDAYFQADNVPDLIGFLNNPTFWPAAGDEL